MSFWSCCWLASWMGGWYMRPTASSFAWGDFGLSRVVTGVQRENLQRGGSPRQLQNCTDWRFTWTNSLAYPYMSKMTAIKTHVYIYIYMCVCLCVPVLYILIYFWHYTYIYILAQNATMPAGIWPLNALTRLWDRSQWHLDSTWRDPLGNQYCWWFRIPAPGEGGSLSHYLQGFIHPRWCRIAFSNSISLMESHVSENSIAVATHLMRT